MTARRLSPRFKVVTFPTPPKPPDRGPSAEVIEARVIQRLQALNGVQLQIVDIVVGAIIRGAA